MQIGAELEFQQKQAFPSKVYRKRSIFFGGGRRESTVSIRF